MRARVFARVCSVASKVYATAYESDGIMAVGRSCIGSKLLANFNTHSISFEPFITFLLCQLDVHNRRLSRDERGPHQFFCGTLGVE